MVTRRDFLDTLAIGAAGLTISSTARSYAQIMGSNDRLNFAVIGLNSRAYAHLSSLKANKDAARISHVCDVDHRHHEEVCRCNDQADGRGSGRRAGLPQDPGDERYRTQLPSQTPDHWHTPMAILGLQAGKNVYVEKPCSHNPAEGAMLIAAQQKYGKLVQMGTQQRSSPQHHRGGG